MTQEEEKEPTTGKRKLTHFKAGNTEEVEDTFPKRSRIDPKESLKKIIDLVHGGTILSHEKRDTFFRHQFAMRELLSNTPEDQKFIQEINETIDSINMQYWQTQDMQVIDGCLVISEEVKERLSENELAKILMKTPQEILDTITSLQVSFSVESSLFEVLQERCPKTDTFLAKEIAKLLITEEMEAYEKIEIIEAIIKIPQDQRKSVIEAAKLFITGEMYTYGKIKIIEAIVEIPQNQRKSVIEASKSFITDEMYAISKIEVIKAIVKIPQDQRESVMEASKSFITEKMASYEKIGIIKAIVEIPQDQRESVMEASKSFITEKMAGYEKIEIIEAIVKIPQDQRESVMEASKPFITEEMSSYNKTEIIEAIVKIPQDQRESVMEASKPFITEEMSSYDKIEIIEAIVKIPQDQRESVTEASKLFITGEMYTGDKIKIIEAVTKVPQERREDICLLARKMVNETKLLDLTSFFIASLSIIPQNDLSLFENSIFLNSSLWDTEINRNLFILVFLLPSELRTTENIIALSKESKDFDDKLLESLEQRLSDDTLPMETLLGLSRFILNEDVTESFGIIEEHPVVQQAIQICTISSLPGENNPFTIFQKHKELRNIPVTFTPPIGTKIPFSINMTLLQEIAKSSKIRREDLPPLATKEKWVECTTQFRSKLEKNPEEGNKALEAFGTTREIVEGPIFGDPQNYLTALLEQDGPVSDIEAKWRAIVSYILDQSTEEVEGQLFTPQEEALIPIMMSIQNCKGGKQWGIDGAYGLLDNKYKYKINLFTPEEQAAFERKREGIESLQQFMKDTAFVTEQERAKALIDLYNEDTTKYSGLLTILFEDDIEFQNNREKYLQSDEDFFNFELTEVGAHKALDLLRDIEKKNAIEKVSEVVRPLIEGLIASDAFLEELTGTKISQGSHCTIYIRNYVGRFLGITDAEPVFDRYTGVLDEEFLKKTREEILQEIFVSITPEVICREVAKNIEISSSLKPFLNDQKFFNEDRMTEEGAQHLLKEIGFFV